ncbi:MAG: cell division protein FtsA [Kiritimatiellae bacterium]|jgi:cell division protein FtsA|nr:cell division protein FtsA [Kiritimatiellia bacterium]MDD2348103.1 cell division protein FtsA [Kiritimatiellia bacterium]MDD3583588.1 cell division protein FtsA [Kiritimatiellia bacterium]HHU14733.1 cell division protein FtsA [Lentisphaerota bacterium]HON46593.1 cell division protein FtsA [Kiritimatiellia bacterium]
MAIPPIAALEIGTSRTVVCVGESENGRVKITGTGSYPTTGVRKGQIFDVTQARTGVETAVKQAEKQSDVSIWQVLLALSGGHIMTTVNPGMLTIRSSDYVVSRDHIEEVIENAKEVHLDPDRQVLHTITQTFTVDDQPGIVKPEGMRCKMLSLNVMAVHGVKSRIENAVNVAKSAGLEVVDVAFSGVCAALAALTVEQKRNGVVLIDLGGGTTNYVAYSNDVVVALGSVAVGGDHVTNDIALAFNIPQNSAEELKRTEGSALIDAESGTERITLKTAVGFEERTLSCKALHTVINARMDETLRVVRARLHEAGVLPHVGGGVVLTGGGAYLRRVTELAQRVFGAPCRIGVPVNVDGLEQEDQPAALCTAAGLALYGHMTYEDRGVLAPVKNIFRGLFRR